MSNITIKKVRVGTDILMHVTLKDNGVKVSWKSVEDIFAFLFADAQSIMAGRAEANIDLTDEYNLIVTYGVNEPQYLGVNRLVISCVYEGKTATYDCPVVEFVEKSAEEGETTAEATQVDLEVSAVNTSLLDKAIDAAFAAAREALDATKTAQEGENSRQEGETLREAAETERTAAEVARKANEAERVKAEDERNSSEQVRKAAEGSRVDAEQQRAEAEQDRKAAEVERVAAELDRANAEKQRQAAEQQRQTAETLREQEFRTAEERRQTAEVGRVQAEQQRQAAEELRAENEVQRQEAAEATKAATADANSATEAANTAAGKANEAAGKANQVADKVTELEQNESYIKESLNTNEHYILLEEGALDNSGNNTPHEGWQRSKDYIPIVTSINSIESSPSYGVSARYYDENKAYVGRDYTSSAKYFRFILTTSEKPTSIYINDGGVTTEYKTEKYKKTLSVGDIKENAVIEADVLRFSLEDKPIFNLVDYSVQNNIGANGAFNIPKEESFYDVAARLNRAESNINAVQKIVTPPAITYIAVNYFYQNAFVGKNGSINATGANYGYSVPFMAFKGDIITIQIAGNPNVTAILSSCNQYGQAINPILLATSSSFIEYTYEVEDTNYFIVSGSLANTPIVKLTSNNVDKTLLSNIKRVESKEEYIRNKHFYFEKSDFIPEVKDSLAYVYDADKANNNEHIVNAVAYPSGEIIACRDYGKVVKIANDGTETTLLTINNASDWRGMYIDKNYNVYVSPHDTLGHGLSVSDRGLYRLAYGETSFEKVISLYNPSSAIPTEQQNNNDTIWTMCEDRNGYLYAGVYAHSTRANPAIYRSIDGGITWSYLYNFIDSGLAVPNGQFGNPMHIHCIIYNEFNDALYCIVGEVETIYKSTNKGVSWVDLGCRIEDEKGTTLIATPDGVLIGSDGHWEGVISKLYSDDKTVKTVGKMWHAEFFAMRKSDVTGWLYAFTKIESAIVNTSIYPPKEAINSATALQTWKDSQSASSVKAWERYNSYVSSHYNHDDIHPNRCAVLVSKDNGETWEIVFSKDCGAYANGIWCVGYFRNGECLCGLTIGDTNRVFTNPIVISEGKHKFGTKGIDISGDIFSKLVE